MRHLFFLALICLSATAFSQQKTKSAAEQIDIEWIKHWGESTAKFTGFITSNCEKQLQLNKEIKQLEAGPHDEITDALIANKRKLIEHLIKANIAMAQIIDEIIQIQKKGFPQEMQ